MNDDIPGHCFASAKRICEKLNQPTNIPGTWLYFDRKGTKKAQVPPGQGRPRSNDRDWICYLYTGEAYSVGRVVNDVYGLWKKHAAFMDEQAAADKLLKEIFGADDPRLT